MAQLNNLTISGFEIFDLVYPVGSIYISTLSANPKDLFGVGEWESIKDRFLLSAGDIYEAGDTGGKSSVTLSAAIGAANSSTNALGYIADGYSSFQAGRAPTYTVYGSNSSNGGTWNHSTPVTEYDSTSRSVNIMPPYVAVYIWKRIS